MVNLNNIDEKVEIEYPTEWRYKVIGESEDSLRRAIDEVLESKEYKLKHSNKSRNGKFISLQASLIVESQDERDSIFVNLKSRAEVRVVI